MAGYRHELGEVPSLAVRHRPSRAGAQLQRGRVEKRARAALALPVLVLDDEAIERIEAISANGTVAALLADLPPEVRAAVEGESSTSAATPSWPTAWSAQRASCASA
jgi:hypothetical protein